jgi:hypothetical protein
MTDFPLPTCTLDFPRSRRLGNAGPRRRRNVALGPPNVLNGYSLFRDNAASWVSDSTVELLLF